MRLIWAILGIVTGAMSISSLLERYSALGLQGMFLDFVTYYQKLSAFVFGSLPSLIGINVPQWLCDIWALSFVITGITMRLIHYDYRTRDILDAYHKPPLLYYLFQSISLLGILSALIYCLPMIKKTQIKRTNPWTNEREPAPCYKVGSFYILKSDVYWFANIGMIAALGAIPIKLVDFIEQ